MARISKKEFIRFSAQLMAFQQPEAPYTPRRGFAAVESGAAAKSSGASLEDYIEDFVEVFGMLPAQLAAVLDEAGMLDVVHFPDNPFV